MLSEQADKQREALKTALLPFGRTLGYADKGMKVYQLIYRHPLLAAGAVALAAYFVPRHWLTVIKNGLMPWGVSLATRYLLKER